MYILGTFIMREFLKELFSFPTLEELQFFFLLLPFYFLSVNNTFPMHHSDQFLLAQTILDTNRVKLVLDWYKQLIGGYGALPVSQ